MHKKAYEHFKTADPILYEAAQKIDLTDFLIPSKHDYFTHLCREIIGQQLSGKVADTIFSRFKDSFPKKKVTPSAVLKLPEQKLRDCGMAWSKVRSIRDIAEKVAAKQIVLENLSNLPDDMVIAELCTLKGVGPWTAEMFLMFTLRRPDIFSHGDYGLQKAIMKLYGFKKKPSKRTVELLQKKWSPYRSYACMILWQSLEI